MHLNILGTPYIFLNSYEAAVELFEKRGAKYSFRPRMVMMELYVFSFVYCSYVVMIIGRVVEKALATGYRS